MGYLRLITSTGLAVGLLAGYQPLRGESGDHLVRQIQDWQTHPYIAQAFRLEADNPRMIHLVGRNFGTRPGDVSVRLVGPPARVSNLLPMVLGGVPVTEGTVRPERNLDFNLVNECRLVFELPVDAGANPVVVVGVNGRDSLPESLERLECFYAGSDLLLPKGHEPYRRSQWPVYTFSNCDRTRYVQQTAEQTLMFNDYNDMVRQAFNLPPPAAAPYGDEFLPLAPRVAARPNVRKPKFRELIQFTGEPRTEYHLVGENLLGLVDLYCGYRGTQSGGHKVFKVDVANNNRIRFSLSVTEDQRDVRVAATIFAGERGRYYEGPERERLTTVACLELNKAILVRNPFELLNTVAAARDTWILDPGHQAWNSQVIAAFGLKQGDVAAHLAEKARAAAPMGISASSAAAASAVSASPAAAAAPMNLEPKAPAPPDHRPGPDATRPMALAAPGR